MKPLKRMSLKDIVIEKLHKHIVDHQLQPGDRFLNEKEIISLVGVSRTVVREALQAMEAVGVLRIKPGDGIIVNESSLHHLVNQFSFRWSRDRSRMLELLETRVMLELSALELIIRRLNSKPEAVEFAEMDARIEQMEKAIKLKLPIMEEDIEFHRKLFKMTGNQTFYELSEVITQYFHEVRESRMSIPEGYGNTLVEHKQIVHFIKQMDLEGAKKTMVKHLSPLKEIIMKGLY
ncbi:FadR/GntR family transcriptional regulator [Paenibacillus nasutitermitis]|uniref:GntR family transcriptional regulator n=1 Tax=Paenibacillus nasutitermitis TaxID=1652958 RepID=A0A917DMM7_9BACL|nr:FadR/GntR family transcriptional regulator [Paenibacillus nasutitermitis]GGD51990.1 GntR family transcriptional regulator [Paenibacillus nasutitermitis]